MGLKAFIDRVVQVITQCEGCEMRRQKWKEMKDKELAHKARFAALRRGEDPDAQAEVATEQAIAPATADAASTRAKPAGKAKPAHGKRSVAKASRGGAAS